ncbi:MAG: hypothetical protein V7750_17110 [Sneathiella sp.]
MARVDQDKQKQAIVDNLIGTCGLQRALHAATQFGWHDIASEISKKLSQTSPTPHQ